MAKWPVIRKQLAVLERLRRFVRFAVRRVDEDRIAQIAASLTFTTLLSLVPLATVAFALFTAFPVFASFQDALQDFLVSHLMPEQVSDQIFLYLNQFAEKARGLTVLGMGGLALTSVMTMMTIESSFNIIWHVRKPRSLAQRVLVYWAILTLGPLLIGVSLSISSYLLTHSLMLASGEQQTSAFGWVLSALTLPISALAFTILYVYLPNCRVQWRDAVVGGVMAAIAFELAKRGFGYYVRHIPTYTAVYGTFAAIPVFLLWVYLSWVVTLAGAMIVSALPEIRAGRFGRPVFPGSDLLDALEMLARLADKREAGAPGCTAQELVRVLQRDLVYVSTLLQTLEEAHLVARIASDAKPRFLLAANPAQLPLARVFALFVLNPAEMAQRLAHTSSRIDTRALLDAMDNEKLTKVSLQMLMRAEAGSAV